MMRIDESKPHETLWVPDRTKICLVVTLYDRVQWRQKGTNEDVEERHEKGRRMGTDRVPKRNKKSKKTRARGASVV